MRVIALLGKGNTGKTCCLGHLINLMHFVVKMTQMAIGNRKTEESFVGMCRNNGQINAEIGY